MKQKNKARNTLCSVQSSLPGDENSIKVDAEPAQKKAKKRKASVTAINETPDIKKIVIKGKAPVDAECPLAGRSHIYYEGDDVWDCMLNQTNVQHNNNKYYLIQVLEEDTRKAYNVWMRWGRVGFKGQNSLTSCGGDVEEAKRVFRKKFHDKTKNNWDERNEFTKVAGKYDLLKMDYSEEGSVKDETDSKVAKIKPGCPLPLPVAESTLEEATRLLIDMICNVKLMEETVSEMEYDARKAPLGKLTKEQITAGYEALKRIDELILTSRTGPALVQACNDFYTRIPHYFGMRAPPLIRSREDLLKKMQLLEALGDIQAALRVMQEEDDLRLHPIDRHYKALGCNLTPLSHMSEEFKLIETFLMTTHASTHNLYSMQLQEVFSCGKDEEMSRFEDKGNRYLLWHGSRLSNWAGILSQGLKIAPPEAPVTGYMFGKGVYFADMSSKSANYCFTTRSKAVGLLLVCEVALGKQKELINADYEAHKLPPGFDSVKGLGKITPNPKNEIILHKPDGPIVPLGPGVESSTKKVKRYTLNYNEYIIYNVKQIKMRYLLKVKFNYK